MKRSRRGGRRPQHNGSNNNNNSGGGNRGGENYNNPNRSFDSNGPEVKVRGSATQVYEKYLQLARDANSSGDRVMAESYLQHAEHYFRIMAAQAEAQQQYQQQNGGGGGNNNQQGGGNNNQQGGNRQPGQGEQPFVGQPGQQGGNGPSFSLNDRGEGSQEEQAEEAGA